MDTIKRNKYTEKIKLVLGSEDSVIPIDAFDIDALKNEYPFLEIEIVKGDHYLGFKK